MCTVDKNTGRLENKLLKGQGDNMVQKFKGFVPEIHESCFLAPGSMIIGQVKMGKGCSVWHNSVIRGDMDEIVIGENVNIQDCSVLHCDTGIRLTIGDNVTVGHGAILHSCDVGENSLIGMGSIVLDGAKVGKYSLVGAGAVVTPNTNIPEKSLVLGSPAKVIRQLSDEEIEKINKNSKVYVSLSQEYIGTED